MKVWKPTTPGKLFTGSDDWEFHHSDKQYTLNFSQQRFIGELLNFTLIEAKLGLFWATIQIEMVSRNFTLDGIPNESAKEMIASVHHAISKEKSKQAKASFYTLINPITKWFEITQDAISSHINKMGWLSRDSILRINASKPSLFIDFDNLEIQKIIHSLPDHQLKAIKFFKTDLWQHAEQINQRQYEYFEISYKSFFNTIEKSPLTNEQIKAVVCFDNRTLLVASAGSGKTSTIIAKCAFAVFQEKFNPEDILILAFNKDAADELQSRIKTRFKSVNIPDEKITVNTFHAFGMRIIGEHTGKKPSIPKWLDQGKDLEHLSELVDDLKDKDHHFRKNWDLFRIVISQDYFNDGDDSSAGESWDRKNDRNAFWTLNNDHVKSRGELILANWFFYNGIRYEYESPYKVDTSDSKHRQYTPDFYFPDIDVYLEHWALDENDEPPKAFKNYKESMVWKRKIHAQYGTKLIETTTAEVWSGKVIHKLESIFTEYGIKLDPNPDRKVYGRKPIENKRLIKTFRTFLTHVKNNRLSIERLNSRLESGVSGRFHYRHRVFLMLFNEIWRAWDAGLRQKNEVDFDDMLNQATDILESGQWSNPYRLILVDEFQDLSQSRLGMLHGLLPHQDQYLFGVGDDWQSINRFAGAHLGVMTDFEANFGRSTLLKLEKTFRCPQSLCDISSQFIQKNPRQIKKQVKSDSKDLLNPILILRVPDEDYITSAIKNRIQSITNQESQKQEILILARYNEEKKYLPKKVDESKVKIKFLSVHSSKGLEADHIIVPKMSKDTYGFPSNIEDDPVLIMAMPEGESFTYAEERRLFYVALTRAKKSVTLITTEKKESPFILELIDQHRIDVENIEGEKQTAEICPKCKNAFIVERNGKYGLFYGCSDFPRCDFTKNLTQISSR